MWAINFMEYELEDIVGTLVMLDFETKIADIVLQRCTRTYSTTWEPLVSGIGDGHWSLQQ